MLFRFAGQSFKKKKSVDILYYRRGLGELEGEGGSKANRLNLNPLFQPPSLHRVAQGGLKTTRLVNRERFGIFVQPILGYFGRFYRFTPPVLFAQLCVSFLLLVSCLGGVQLGQLEKCHYSTACHSRP